MTPQIKEIINRNSVTSIAYEKGYSVFLPEIDSGIDFILYRESDGDLKLVQQKSRWTINKKYLGRSIWIVFPVDERWYMVLHDEIVEKSKKQGYTKTNSWEGKGGYHQKVPSKSMMEFFKPHRFET